MMTILKNRIEYDINKEYDLACRLHGAEFNSLHEAYAVLKEEQEEAKLESDVLNYECEKLWSLIKSDAESDIIEGTLENIYRKAVLGACELVQTAAMAKKALKKI